MKHETQAFHLAKMMQKHTNYPTFELILPPVMIRTNKLKKLSVEDVLLLGIDRLEFLLMDGDTIHANIQLKSMQNAHVAEVVHLDEETIEQSDSKKYKTLMISFGTVQSKALKIGSTVDVTHLDLGNVSVVLEHKTIAEGSLVNVDDEIALEIKKIHL